MISNKSNNHHSNMSHRLMSAMFKAKISHRFLSLSPRFRKMIDRQQLIRRIQSRVVQMLAQRMEGV
jgi:hypothetical protein